MEGSTSLQLKASLIAFHRLRGGHDGVSLGKTVFHLLDRAGVTVKVAFLIVGHAFTDLISAKVGHFTVDNASNNETMMQELERLLQAREIPFDAQDRKIMCYSHVIDLSCGRIVDGLSRVNTRSDTSDWDADELPSLIEPTYTDAMARDTISHARTVVRVIRGSGMRRDAFDDVITNGNSKGWFKAGQPLKIVQLKRLQLLRDVRTRWDSEYYMLNRLRELRPVSTYLCIF